MFRPGESDLSSPPPTPSSLPQNTSEARLSLAVLQKFRFREKVESEAPLRFGWRFFVTLQLMQFIMSICAVFVSVLVCSVLPFVIMLPAASILEPSSMLLVLLAPLIILQLFGALAASL